MNGGGVLGVLKIGDTDRDGRQKRIEHTGRYLRASRTGGVSLRAQTRVSGVNLTANTNHGVRVSTRLAKNTQVAFQNGRFILRGRYRSDAAKVNLSKSGVTVSTKTPVGSFNWIRPGRSSFKLGGVQLRGHNAAWLQAIYALFALVAAVVGLLLRVLAGIVQGVVAVVGHFALKRQLAAEETARPRFELQEVAAVGERICADQGIDPDAEPARDLLAALSFIVISLGRGERRFEGATSGMVDASDAASHAFATDARTTGEQVGQWLPDAGNEQYPLAVAGTLHALASALARRVDADTRAEALLALDDACLAAGPKTLLQEELIDLLVPAMEVDVVLAGES